MSSTWACRQTRLEKSGAKGTSACTILGGRVRTRHLFLADCGDDERTLPPFALKWLKSSFQRLSEKSFGGVLSLGFGSTTRQDRISLPPFTSL